MRGKKLYDKRKRPSALNLVGEKFGDLTVLSFDGEFSSKSGKSRYRCWVCVCSCGTERPFFQGTLLRGLALHCGCKTDASNIIRGYFTRKRKYTPEQRAERKLLSSYKNAASVRGLDFSLTDGEFLSLIYFPCFYCGSSPKLESRFWGDRAYRSEKKPTEPKATIVYNGLDRVDNSIGYSTGNTVPCCESCNRSKLEVSIDDFSEWVDQISGHKSRTHWLRDVSIKD